MGVKTRYREKPAQDIPASEKLNTPATETPVAPAPKVIKDAEKEAASGDEATLRLQRQLSDLHQSEQLQLQRQAAVQQVQQQQVSPEWRSFIEDNPRLAQNFDLAYAAAAQAQQEGHAVNSRGQMERALELVNGHLGHAAEPEPTPRFFQPPPAPEPPDHSVIVSAPPSREASYGGSYRGGSHTSVRLTVQQREAAALAGISEVEYARQLGKMPAYFKQRGIEHE